MIEPAPARLEVVRPPGLVPYEDAYERMHDLARQRLAGAIGDTLLLLEHPPVFTAGRRTGPRDVRWTTEAIEAAGAQLHHVDRGGNVTFHGPGQLVGYPILDLGPRPDVARYVRDLEEVVIRACAAVGIPGLGRSAANPGVWAGDRKVCAVGIRVMRMRVALHGFALNCATDLRWYEAIVPCGLPDRGVTSLTELACRAVSVGELVDPVVAAFDSVFDAARGPTRAASLAG
jgi:lipoyl(octanoyl) transferase